MKGGVQDRPAGLGEALGLWEGAPQRPTNLPGVLGAHEWGQPRVAGAGGGNHRVRLSEAGQRELGRRVGQAVGLAWGAAGVLEGRRMRSSGPGSCVLVQVRVAGGGSCCCEPGVEPASA
jgi:hypothetical protein